MPYEMFISDVPGEDAQGTLSAHLLAHFRMLERPVDYVALRAVRVIDVVRENVKRWIKVERKLLDGLLD